MDTSKFITSHIPSTARAFDGEEEGNQRPEAFDVDVNAVTAKDADDAIKAMSDHLAEIKAKIDAGEALISESREYVELVKIRDEKRAELNAVLDELSALPDAEDNSEDGEDGEQAKDESLVEKLQDDSDDDSGEGGESVEDEASAEQLVTAALAKLASQGSAPLKLSDGEAKPAVAPKFASMHETRGALGDGQAVDDMEWASKVADFVSSSTGQKSMDLGSWNQWEGESTPKIASGMTRTQIMEITGRDWSGNHKLDPKTAAPCEPGCVRREIREAGNMADPLNIFSEFPCDRGHTEYFTAIPLSDVSDGVTVWDAARQTAYDAAYSAWTTLARQSSPDTAALAAAYATLQAATKDCVRAACQTGKTAVVLPIAICLEITNEVGYSSPEAVLAYRSALARLLLRRRNAQRRFLLQGFAHHYSVDGTNTAYGNVGAGPMIFQALAEALNLGVATDRLEIDGYSVGVDQQLLSYLGIDLVKNPHSKGFGMDDIQELMHGLPIVPLLDKVDSSPVVAGTPVGAPDLLPDEAVTLATAGQIDDPPALPNLGDGRYQIELFRPADFDTISVPNISLSATRGPAEAKQNIELNMFLETFEGLMKPGAQPNFTLTVDNIVPSGGRADVVTAQVPS